MRDRELDARLKEARQEAGQFFAGWSFSPLREVVHRRTKDRPAVVRSTRKRYLVLARRLLGVAAAVLVLLWLPQQLKTNLSGPRPLALAGPERPVAQYAVNLKEGTQHRLSFFRLSHPDWQEDQLLAVIWEQSRPTAAEDYHLLYSTAFGGRVHPEPSRSIELPGSDALLDLISTRNQELEYLHYRVVGYDGQRVTSYREQDFVPGGELEVRSGILVEQRQTSAEPAAAGIQVNLLVPYQIDAAGDLLLPTERLQMEVGQYLTFIGTSEQVVHTYLKGTALDRLEGKEGAQAGAQFHAVRSGTGAVLLEPGSGTGHGRQFLVEVIPPAASFTQGD